MEDIKTLIKTELVFGISDLIKITDTFSNTTVAQKTWNRRLNKLVNTIYKIKINEYYGGMLK